MQLESVDIRRKGLDLGSAKTWFKVLLTGSDFSSTAEAPQTSLQRHMAIGKFVDLIKTNGQGQRDASKKIFLTKKEGEQKKRDWN